MTAAADQPAAPSRPRRTWLRLLFATGVFLVALELLLQFGALVAAWTTAPPPTRPGTGANVVCVGDSFTYGIGASAPANSYPGALQQRLRTLGLAATVRNGGRPGKDSAEVLRHLEADLTDGVEVLCVLLGTNDTWSHPDPLPDTVGRPPGAFEWRWRTGRLLALATRFAFGSWQRTAPDAAPTVDLADPAAGFALLERLGVIPATPRELLLPPACPTPPSADVDRALRLAQSGDAAAALPIAAAAAAAHPDCAHAWLAVAVAADGCGEADRAAEALARLHTLAADARDPAAAYALLTALGALRHAAEQYAFAQRRVAVEPRDVLAWKALQEGAFVLDTPAAFLAVVPDALALAGRLDPGESAVALRHYARAVCSRDAPFAARLIVAALLLDGDRDATRAVLGAVASCATAVTFAAALADEGVPPAARAAIEGLLAPIDAAPWRDVLRLHLERIAAAARARGAAVVFVGYPFWNEPLEAVQREAAAALDVPFVSLHAHFAAALRTRPRDDLFVADGHCTDAGYAIVAEHVATSVATLLRR